MAMLWAIPSDKEDGRTSWGEAKLLECSVNICLQKTREWMIMCFSGLHFSPSFTPSNRFTLFSINRKWLSFLWLIFIDLHQQVWGLSSSCIITQSLLWLTVFTVWLYRIVTSLPWWFGANTCTVMPQHSTKPYEVCREKPLALSISNSNNDAYLSFMYCNT